MSMDSVYKLVEDRKYGTRGILGFSVMNDHREGHLPIMLTVTL